MSSQEPSKIDALFQKRFHGAGNHRGALYHSLYGCHLGLSLNGSLKSRLGTERYEDLEVESSDGALSLYQLKCKMTRLDYSEIEKILNSFAEVIRERNVASCYIVTATGYPPEVENWLVDPHRRSMPAKLKDRIKKVANGDAQVISVLSDHLTCVTVQTDDLCREVGRKISEQVGLTQAAHESFLHALVFKMYTWSGARETISQAMIANVIEGVKFQFEAGLANPAVAQGFIVPLSFNVPDTDADDFYKGRASRAGHIAAQKDVRRAKAQAELEHSLRDSNVTAIISSSGQGKSALALRHLSDYTTENFVYEVKVCRTSEDAAAIALFVRFRLQLELGVSLLIDNLSRAQCAWNELASALAGLQVKIIITSREEDWKLFSGDLSRIAWKRVTPTLELIEARQIFTNLRNAGALHPSIEAPDKAYSRVSEAKLLIEYVYLLTQGELLEERLSSQIANVNERDPGAIECLRLISLADQMNLRVEATALLEMVEFRGDAQLALKGLEGEYVVVQDGLCSGLHPVRSQHLVRLLHNYGIEPTLAKLLRLVDDKELPEFAYSILARTDSRPERLVEPLVARFVGRIDFRAMWEAAFAGSEVRHAQRCLHLLETLEERVGRAAVNPFPLLTPPLLGDTGALEALRGIMDAERFEVLRETIESVPARDYASRFEAVLATQYARVSDMNRSVGDTIALAKAFWLSGQNDEVNALLDALKWRELLLTVPLPLALRMSFLAQKTQASQYEDFVLARRDEVVAYLVQETRSLSIKEVDDKLIVSFIVNPYNGIADNEQAVSRLQAAKGLLPGYGSYATEPVRPIELPIPLPHDDAYKDGPSENWYSEEITSLDKQWTAAIDVVTASDSIVGWEWTQRSAIDAATSILEHFARFIWMQDEGRNISKREIAACEDLFEEFEQRKEARRHLPSNLRDEERELEAVGELFDAASALLSSIYDELVSKAEGEINRKQVILGGLRNVHTFSQAAQDALDSLRQRSGLENGQDFTKRLHTFAESLYKSVERRTQIERGQRCLCSLSPSSARFLHARLRDESEDLARRVKIADRALLYTPGNELKRFDLPSWPFTLEVQSLEDFVTEALSVCMVFADSFDSFLGYFIAVPVFQGERVSPRVFRALAPVLRDALAGQEPESLVIWPRDDADERLNAVLGLQPYRTRPELELVQQFLDAGEKLSYARAASLVEARTPGASSAFADWLCSEPLAASFHAALGALKEFVPAPPLAAHWNDVLHAVDENVAVLERSPEQFLLTNNLLTRPLDRYLAARLAQET